MNKREFLGTFKLLAVTPLVPLLNACEETSTTTSTTTTTTTTSNTFVYPPIVSPNSSNEINLKAVDGTTEFYSGTTSVTKGFVDVNNNANTSYLAPTIRITSTNTNSSTTGTKLVDQGSQSSGANNVKITVENTSANTISAHWHGLHVDGFVDGGPYNSIASGTTWEPTLPIYQQATTNWYHTHIHGSTATEVYQGLAGLFIIDDANSAELDKSLPSDYGVDDYPLIIQDKSFNNNVMDSSNVAGRFAGDVFLVNGVVTPTLEVEAGLTRFRILNASNARFYDFSITSGGTTGSFQKIATEGGFISSPVNMSSLRMAPGERNEIVIDFSSYSVGDSITLVSADNENNGNVADSFTLMTFTVKAQTTQTSTNSVPTTLNADFAADRTALMAKTASAFVSIDLKGGPNPFASARSLTSEPNAQNVTLNTSSANFVSTSTKTTTGYTEQWRIRGGRHPFHLHGCHAMIKTINGQTPSADLQGWKDVFEVNTGEDVIFMVQFDERAYSAGSNAGEGAGTDFMYMMHCHILGHEDAGMMGVFEVI